ncbi:MAG: sugar transferase [Paracoccaceae bacterium]
MITTGEFQALDRQSPLTGVDAGLSKTALGVPVAARPRARGLLSGAELKSGYRPRSEFVDALFNRSLAALAMFAVLPMFVAVWLLVRLTSPGPVFYRGARLGRDRKIFHMYKFRTLEAGAGALTADKTLPRRNQLETPVGTYLRKSRLDELPQLLNILRGEMVLFGPRPIRPEMEWRYALEAPGYEARFDVRPGLVGLAQALMSHETPKAVRSRLNRLACRGHVNYLALTGFVFFVGLTVLRRTLGTATEALRDLRSPFAGQKWLRSGFSRTPGSRIEVVENGKIHVAAMNWMSDEIAQCVATQPLKPGSYDADLIRRSARGRIARVRVTLQVQSVLPLGLGQPGFAHFCSYRVNGAYSRYLVERYFLRSAVVPV